MNPTAFELGPIAVHWHSILIVGGILIAALISAQTARRLDKDPLRVWEALPWTVALGLVGARLYYALALPPSIGVDRWYYLWHPVALLAVWEGGLAPYGALLGGTAGLLIALRRERRHLWRWLDIAAPGAALGQALARWGNWINQEGYGLPTNLPWGVLIQPEFRLPGYEAYDRFQPLYAYASAWTLLTGLILLVLIWRRGKRLVAGLVAGIYFLSYATAQFLLEFMRLDRPTFVGIPVAQVLSLAIALTWIALLAWRLRTEQRAEPS
jgi:phosphatidylglycerol:prolipoprotein diacylglycerol transferase